MFCNYKGSKNLHLKKQYFVFEIKVWTKLVDIQIYLMDEELIFYAWTNLDDKY